MKLEDMVYVLRSKNAGVWHITIDIIFKSKEYYEIARKKLNKDIFKAIYKRESIRYFECDSINTIKVTFLRNEAAGSVNDRDCLGALQYIPLLGIEI